MPITHSCFQTTYDPQDGSKLDSAAFQMFVSRPAESVIGRPVRVEVAAVNVSEQAQPVQFNPAVLILYMQKDGKLVRHSNDVRAIVGELEEGDPAPQYSGPIVTYELQPGAIFTRDFDLNSYFIFNEAGTYQLCAFFPQAHLTVERTITLKSRKD